MGMLPLVRSIIYPPNGVQPVIPDVPGAITVPVEDMSVNVPDKTE
jgi:hypothetical protein